jgi:isoleucyl-tRNA synthetase
VLTTLVRLVAPLLPFVSEEIHLGLAGAGPDGTDSVHLADWPDAASLPADPELVSDMDRVREVCSVALGLREDHRLRARLPLRRLTVAGRDVQRLGPLTGLVADEVNVKEVELTHELTAVGTFQLRPNARVLGPRLGKSVQDVIRAAKAGDWTDRGDGTVEVAGQVLSGEEFEMALEARDGTAAAPLRGNDAVVQLDVEVTPELAAEGLARDVVRAIQQARKDAELAVTDRVRVELTVSEQTASAVRTHRDWVADQVLAVQLDVLVGSADEPSVVLSAQK